MTNTNDKVRPFGFFASIFLFGGAGVILFLETHYLVPLLTRSTAAEPVIWWFIAGGLGMFLPLLLVAAILLKQEGWSDRAAVWKNRMRFRPMNRTDWIWTLGGLLAIGAFSYLIMRIIPYYYGEIDHQPSFMQFDPLGPGRYWILAAWLPFWTLNIMGEEILWRGVILPRQEISFGKSAWAVHGLCWGIFHLAFGWQLLLILLPILFILPFIAQKRKNSWIAVILHAVINGPSFVAIALGAL